MEDSQKNGQTVAQTDGRTDIQKDKQIKRQTNKCMTMEQKDGSTNRWKNRERQTVIRQLDRQRDGQYDIQY
jgi:hypothetical protein